MNEFLENSLERARAILDTKKRLVFVARYEVIEPLGAEYLMGLARDLGWEVTPILIKGFNFEPLYWELMQHGANLVCFSIWTGFHIPALAAAKKVRSQGFPVAIGGPHATFSASQCLPCADWVIKNDGFRLFKKLLSGELEKGLHFDPHRDDPFPMPARKEVYDAYPELGQNPIKSLICSTGCPFTCSYSKTDTCKIFTDAGLVTVGDLLKQTPGYSVKCEHGGVTVHHETERLVASEGGLAQATVIVEEGVQPVFEVLASNGFHVEATAASRLRIVRDNVFQWSSVEGLQPSDWLVLQTPEIMWPEGSVKFVTDLPSVPREMSEDLAWVTGYLLGDGCLPRSGAALVHFSVKKRAKEKLCRVIPELFGKELRISPASNTTVIENGRLFSRSAHDFFRRVVGISAENKLHVPASIYRSSRNVIKAFLRGLWCADGYFGEGSGVSGYLTTVSKEFAEEVALLILMLGQPPYVQEVKTHPSQPNHKIRKFYYRVGQLANDRIPTEKALYKSKKSDQWHWRTLRSGGGLGVRRRTLEESGLFHPLNVPGRFYVPLKHVKPVGEKPVYDITVPGEETFIANGFIAHNCYAPHRNDMIKEAIGGPGFRLELRDISEIIKEALWVKEHTPVSMFYMQDDIFGFRLDWLVEFADRWPREVGIPWHCQIRLEMTREEKRLDLFKAGGCTGITVAIESGNEFLRQHVLFRHMPDELIVEGIRRIQKRGLTVRTEQILQVPFSDLETDLQTLELNIRLAPDLAWSSILAPYGGTNIGTVATKFGFFDKTNDDLQDAFFERSVLRHTPRSVREDLEPVVDAAVREAKDHPLLRMKVVGQAPRAYFDPVEFEDYGVPIAFLSQEQNERYCDQGVMLQRLFNWAAKVPQGERLMRKFLDLPKHFWTWEILGQQTEMHLYRLTYAPEVQDAWLKALDDAYHTPSEAVAKNPWYFVFLPSGADFAWHLDSLGFGSITDPEKQFALIGRETRHWLYDRALYRVQESEPSIFSRYEIMRLEENLQDRSLSA